MNKLCIIGNLTRDPESRTTQSGKEVCTFTVAVNRTGQEKEKTDYFRVGVWEKLADSCKRYLSKGKKVCVIGRVWLDTYKGNDGEMRGQLMIDGQDVEFLSPRDRTDEEMPLS